MTVENYWASPTVETRPQWKKIRSMFTLLCCSLAGLKMSLRTGFCCRNVLARDKIKARRKLYLSLPHIGILACFICSFGMGPCYRLQYWDGTFSPANFLHLLTCKFFTCSIGMAPSHLQFFSGRFFTCSFGMAPSRAAKFTAKKNNQWNHGGFATTSTRLPLKMQNSPKTKMIKGIVV